MVKFEDVDVICISMLDLEHLPTGDFFKYESICVGDRGELKLGRKTAPNYWIQYEHIGGGVFPFGEV